MHRTAHHANAQLHLADVGLELVERLLDLDHGLGIRDAGAPLVRLSQRWARQTFCMQNLCLERLELLRALGELLGEVGDARAGLLVPVYNQYYYILRCGFMSHRSGWSGHPVRDGTRPKALPTAS